jgi:hypothetical protein
MSETRLPMMVLTDEPPQLTTEIFVEHMKAMSLHYRLASVGHVQAYPLPINLRFAPGALLRGALGGGADEVGAALEAAKAALIANTEGQKNAVTTATQNLQNSKDTAAFIARMNAQKAQAKADSNKLIEENYNRLIDLGTRNPGQQARIISVGEQLGAFVAYVWTQICVFFTNLWNSIVAWLQQAGAWIQNAARDIGNWFTEMFGKIGQFFASV